MLKKQQLEYQKKTRDENFDADKLSTIKIELKSIRDQVDQLEKDFSDTKIAAIKDLVRQIRESKSLDELLILVYDSGLSQSEIFSVLRPNKKKNKHKIFKFFTNRIQPAE